MTMKNASYVRFQDALLIVQNSMFLKKNMTYDLKNFLSWKKLLPNSPNLVPKQVASLTKHFIHIPITISQTASRISCKKTMTIDIIMRTSLTDKKRSNL